MVKPLPYRKYYLYSFLILLVGLTVVLLYIQVSNSIQADTSANTGRLPDTYSDTSNGSASTLEVLDNISSSEE